MEKTEQLKKVWEDNFGEEYTKRKLEVHETEGNLRDTFWKELVQMVPDASTYLEIGCNAGMNLISLHNASTDIKLTGLEPNDFAFNTAVSQGEGKFDVIKGNVFDFDVNADLVFTCTVLIHIAPDDLKAAMEEIYKASNKYVLAMEYYWPELKEIEYRGLKNILWKQDFGAFWLKNFDLEIMETGYLDARDGFDRVTWWLFKKK
jgi:pseudaminic acid biosynthesis-associated methylase